MYTFNSGYSFFCEPVDFSTEKIPMIIANGCHTYFLLKVVDLLDTVFFVLRKKDKQISFLHLYHHTGMVVLTWNATKFYPGGHSIFTGFINSIIHVVMYTYYLVSAFQPQYKNNLWWKKYITQMQIVSIYRTFHLIMKDNIIKTETAIFTRFYFQTLWFKKRFLISYISNNLLNNSFHVVVNSQVLV